LVFDTPVDTYQLSDGRLEKLFHIFETSFYVHRAQPFITILPRVLAMKNLISPSEENTTEDHPDTEDFVNSYLNLIGQIVVSFNSLEKQIKDGIAQLISDDLGMTTRITAGEPFMNLQRLLNVLFRYRVSDRTQLTKLDELNKTLGDVDVQRNNYVHSEWFMGRFFPMGEPFAQRYKASKNALKIFKGEKTFPRVQELEQFVVRINGLTNELASLLKDNSKQIRAHRKKTERNRLLPITNL